MLKSRAHLTAALIDQGLPEGVADCIATSAFGFPSASIQPPSFDEVSRRLSLQSNNLRLEHEAIDRVLNFDRTGV